MRPGQPGPALDLTPREFERLVAARLREAADGSDATVEHDVTLSGPDGDYQIDVVVRLRVMGADVVVLVECKRHADPVKREVVNGLNDKVRSLGANKGAVASTSGFQSGARRYAKAHGIALVDVYDDSLDWELRSANSPTPPPSGRPAAHWIEATEGNGYRSNLLDGRPEAVRSMLLAEPER